MIKLVFFELDKMWKKRSFIISVIFILIINVFLLWYINLPMEHEPELKAYKIMENDLKGKTEQEKYDYIEKAYEDILGFNFVENILSYQASSEDFIKEMAQQEMDANPGVFEKYYAAYEKGDYLRYTDNIMKEKEFLTEVYDEMVKVSGYQEYLDGVQETRNRLNGISIFASSKSSDNFSSRNIEKSAEDYEKMRDVNITFYPSKGIATATRNIITDVLLILSVFLFVGGMIYEEKEKKLFYVTRATVRGRGVSIGAKLLALGINCVVMSAFMYIANLVFFANVTGIGSLNACIQSVAPFMESNLHISVFTYIILSVITKAFAMFCIGAFVTFVSIIAKQSFMPYLIGAVMIAGCVLSYNFIPAYSTFNYLKYLNFIGLFKTENLYGGYLNFNLFGYPIPRIVISVIMIVLYICIGVYLSVIAFIKCTNMEIKKPNIPFSIKFKPHSSLFRHESYKIFITNKALMILLIFIVLIGYRHVTGGYSPSLKEEYYQSFMIRLEGELNDEKKKLIEEEQERYQAAFDKIAEIDELIASGKIEQMVGENMKNVYYSETAFYPAFERVLDQYEYIQENGGRFVYDTGYLYLFGVIDSEKIMDLVFQVICIILCFSSVLAMEHQKKSWNLLSATAKGRKSIIHNKKKICIISSVAICIITWGFVYGEIMKSFPMNELFASIKCIPSYRDFGINIPIFAWMAIMIAVQVLAMIFMTMLVMLMSDKLKSQLQAMFVAMLILGIPLILKAMGIDFAQWFSIYPVYTMTGLILENNGIVIVTGYLVAVIAGTIGCSYAIEKSN